MPLNGYGLLIGKITASRPVRKGQPHWLLMVEPGIKGHPPYRVAVNLQATVKDQPPEIQYQIADIGATPAGKKLLVQLNNIGQTAAFMPSDANRNLPRLDFVRGGIIDPARFTDVPVGTNPFQSEFEAALAAATDVKKNPDTLIAVFGTGSPIDPATGAVPPTGYTGIDNIHMNQGSPNRVNSDPYYLENGPNQDGGLIFLLPSGAKGFFVKFHSQTISTDADGNPTVTGIDVLDDTPDAVRKAIMPPLRKQQADPAAPSANESNYVFADFNPDDASGAYIPDIDANTYKTPYVMTRSTGHTRGPVPSPRDYPRLDLATVVGATPPGYAKDASSERIAFDVIGDSGAPSQSALNDYELKVTDLMTRDAQASPPAFLFHVGDVVYFYGEENYYYSQFYEPFRAYPAPIFAIPGNHDGITYNDSMVSLDPFQKAFCATAPGRWEGSGGLRRSTMTQPGVYFTLDAPLVSIIGLYSNCGESFGWLDEQQLLFLYQELIRLKARRKNGLPAVILAIHHFPRWFPDQKPKDPTSAAIDATCGKAGFWPDAVICGHAHLFQRIVRQNVGKDVPYVMTGAGGYGLSAREEIGKSYMATIAPSGNRLGRVLVESGYVRASVTNPSKGDPVLQFEYHSVKQTTDQPDDVCAVNLRTNKLI